jgi:L-ascorbate metabolism protein UlaG (beta-lactamase superfamily)
MIFAVLVLKYFFIFCIGCAILIFIIDRNIRASGWHGPVTDHFDGRRFYNIGSNTTPPPAQRSGNFWKWILSRPPNDWVWRDNNTSGAPKKCVNGSTLVVTMVNHATLLLQTEGKNILTDPIWSERASPFSFVGPKRYRHPGIAFEQLPPIDVVLISHNHYDHMDIPTLLRLQEAFHPVVIVPIGNKTYLETRGIEHVFEYDWWEKTDLGDSIHISSVPAQHFSARAISDRNTTLWGGYVIETPHGNTYIAGDTGYGPFVKSITERFSSMRLALIPIGAFRPEFFMGPVHVSPSEALLIAKDLHAGTMIPMHYGTFHLADDRQDEPLQELQKAIEKTPSSVQIVVLSNGESTQVPEVMSL